MEVSNKDLVFTLTVYATAPDYDKSKPATMKFAVKKTDVNGDGHSPPFKAIARSNWGAKRRWGETRVRGGVGNYL